MVKKTAFTLLAGLSLALQATSQTANSDQTPKQKDQVTVTGCVARQNGDYILVQADQGNSFQLERSGKLHFKHYLGQEVEVTGTEHPSMATSSDFLARSGPGSPVTIHVTEIKTVAERCGGD